MTGTPPSVVLTFAPVPPGWFVLLVLGLLFGPPIAGMAYGVRSGDTERSEYVLAGGLSLGLVAVWVLEFSLIGELLGDPPHLPVLVASVGFPVAHGYRCRNRGKVGVLGVVAVYTPSLLLFAVGAWFGV